MISFSYRAVWARWLVFAVFVLNAALPALMPMAASAGSGGDGYVMVCTDRGFVAVAVDGADAPAGQGAGRDKPPCPYCQHLSHLAAMPPVEPWLNIEPAVPVRAMSRVTEPRVRLTWSSVRARSPPGAGLTALSDSN